MGNHKRVTETCIVVILSALVISAALPTFTVRPVHAVTPASVVYVDPVSTGGPSFKPANSIFTINVRLNMTAGEVMNEFDVRLNYSKAYVIVKADSVNYANNIFASYSGTPVHSCIDGIGQITGGCESGQTPDSIGQVHFGEVILGQTVSGITAVLLFSIQFHVVQNGTSVFTVDRANIVDPVGSDPSKPNPHFNYVLKNGGVFANTGLVAFYNFDPYISAALLPGQPVVFDARGSFNANNTGIPVANYSWAFGDGLNGLTLTPTVLHTFIQPGTYLVSLIVSTSGSQGTKSPAYAHPVVIVPALGNIVLAFRDSTGAGLSDTVKVQFFNLTSPTAFASKTGQGVITFNGLSPGQYTLKFSGLTVQNYSKVENIAAGLTTPDTIYLTLIPAPPDYGAIIFLGSLAVGIGLLTVLIVLKYIRSRSLRKQKKAL